MALDRPVAKRTYPLSKVRSGGQKEIPYVQGKEQWLHFAGAAVKRPQAQGKRNPTKMVGAERGHWGQTDWNHNHRKLTNLITLSNSMKLSHAVWGHPRQTGHGGEVWQNVVRWRRECQTTSVFLPWEPHKQYEQYEESNTVIRLIIFFAAKDGEALYSQQKQDWVLTVAQIMNFLLPNPDLSWK